MLFNKIIIPNITLLNFCYFHTTRHKLAIGSTMKKIMSGSTKKRRRVYSDEFIVPTSNVFTKDLFKKNNPENTRRLATLNKLFMMRITDLMTTGEYATQFAGYGLEINRVKVAPDYHIVNVYWIAKKSINNDEIEKILQDASGQLRHELTQLHVIGCVPKIKFVKDKEYARYMDIESRLAYADFGEDHEQSGVTVTLRSYLELNKTLDSKLKEQIMAMDETHKVDNNEEIPPMPQNVLGLNHLEIMNRIKKAVKKSQASHRSQNDLSGSMEHCVNSNPIEFKNPKDQREAFQKFLSEREILRKKSEKLKKNYRPDKDFFEEESEILRQHKLNSFKFNDWDDNDYVDEDDEISNSEDKRLE